MKLIIFRLDRNRLALPLPSVERLVRAVEVAPLPGAPPVVMGAIDVAGHIIPVLNLRRRFGLPEHEISPDDLFLIARTGERDVVLVVDEAEGVVEFDSSAMTDVRRLAPGLEWFARAVGDDDGLILIHDLETFLSADESRSLDVALTSAE